MIAIIGCGAAKKDGHHAARDLYMGNLFKAHLRFAERLKPRELFVVSAKYGLVQIDEELESYELKLADLDRGELGSWRRRVALDVEALTEMGELVVILSGEFYASWSDACHRRLSQPFAGLMVGERLQFVSRLLGPS